GIICKNCNGQMKEVGRKNTICWKCSTLEEYDQAIKRNIEDFCCLFPDEKITVNAMSDWLNHQTTPFRIRAHLFKYFTLMDSGSGSYYIFKNPMNNEE